MIAYIVIGLNRRPESLERSLTPGLRSQRSSGDSIITPSLPHSASSRVRFPFAQHRLEERAGIAPFLLRYVLRRAGREPLRSSPRAGLSPAARLTGPGLLFTVSRSMFLP